MRSWQDIGVPNAKSPNFLRATLSMDGRGARTAALLPVLETGKIAFLFFDLESYRGSSGPETQTVPSFVLELVA